MTAVTQMTLEEYLVFNDDTGNRYELVEGNLVIMALGTGEHGDISEFVNARFKAAIKESGLSWTSKDMKIGIQSPRGNRWDTCRIPDVVVLPLTQWEGLRKKESIIRLNEPPPLLVVEVVSPSTITADYRTKRTEYAVLDIPEYWIVDPDQAIITVCTLYEGAYDDRIFRGSDRIESSTFPRLELTVDQVLKAE